MRARRSGIWIGAALAGLGLLVLLWSPLPAQQVTPFSGPIEVSAAITGTGSRQLLEIDAFIGRPAAGSSTAASPAYIGAVMGNVIADQALTATHNMYFGILGKLSFTSTISGSYPAAGVVGEISGDPVTTAAYAAVMAVMGGDAGTTTATALYGVEWHNSTPATRVNFGLDLQGAGTHDSYFAPRYNQAHIRLGGRSLDNDGATLFTANNICWPAVVNGAPTNGASGTRVNVCGPGSLLIRADNGTLYVNTNTLASPTWTVVGSQS